MTFRTEIRHSNQGKFLVAVLFERESPEADTPMVEAVYEVRFPEESGSTASFLSTVPRILRFLSSTRTDTRTPIVLTPEEEDFCAGRASDKAMEIPD